MRLPSQDQFYNNQIYARLGAALVIGCDWHCQLCTAQALPAAVVDALRLSTLRFLRDMNCLLLLLGINLILIKLILAKAHKMRATQALFIEVNRKQLA